MVDDRCKKVCRRKGVLRWGALRQPVRRGGHVVCGGRYIDVGGCSSARRISRGVELQDQCQLLDRCWLLHLPHGEHHAQQQCEHQPEAYPLRTSPAVFATRLASVETQVV